MLYRGNTIILSAKGRDAAVRRVEGKKKFCYLCMQEHEVETVELMEWREYKGEEINFLACYEYCPVANEYLETESMIRSNRSSMKEAYRRSAVINAS